MCVWIFVEESWKNQGASFKLAPSFLHFLDQASRCIICFFFCNIFSLCLFQWMRISWYEATSNFECPICYTLSDLLSEFGYALYLHLAADAFSLGIEALSWSIIKAAFLVLQLHTECCLFLIYKGSAAWFIELIVT